MRKKYIVVTWWVISGIGKWVTTASAGFFLTERFWVTPIKLDWYLNIDPGTMNPHEHGEVFVLADGAEVDMDFGHYERFLWIECLWMQSISMGKIYAGILEKERRGDFLGKTVQMIPHVTDHICERIEQVFEAIGWDICMIEVGGTVWDIEVELYLEAIRQMKRSKRQEDFIHIHLTYVPIPWWVDEQKTKPTQQSINLLQSRGLFPDMIIARGTHELTPESRAKIALFSNLSEERVFSVPDVQSIYEIPQILEKQWFDSMLEWKLCTGYQRSNKIDLWETSLKQEKSREVSVAIIWKYMALEDSYSSVVAALEHVGHTLGVTINIHFLDTRKWNVIFELEGIDACIVPGWFGNSGIENMIDTLTYIRENTIPCLGICLGMQLMVIECMRNIAWISKANSLEFDEKCAPHDVVTLLDSQKWLVNLWGSMRLWKQSSILKEGQIYDLYEKADRLKNQNIINERFRHRYEINPDYKEKIHNCWITIAGESTGKQIVQFIEMDSKIHPYYVATQAHPELSSKLENPWPLFYWLIKASIK